MIHAFRRLLIQMGKVLPFLLCFVVLVGYIESFIMAITRKYVIYGSDYIICGNISVQIGSVFEYNYLTVVAMFILSYATETCHWNKLAVLYLFVHLLFKAYIQDIELEETEICILSIINVILSGFLVYKGIKVLKLC